MSLLLALGLITAAIAVIKTKQKEMAKSKVPLKSSKRLG
jgi:hypothetical protein